ncbi:MAG: flagellar biosynthesis anti-sigma factor FlgM, partial [Betaproteobacteria bacterium]|nr:flagellar biosynthesis anti-sigma factor FlgM [Betaproteobacteria bacterium]
DTAKRVMSGPDFDAAKVDRIKKAIQEGSYPVDARKVAQSFAELEKLI